MQSKTFRRTAIGMKAELLDMTVVLSFSCSRPISELIKYQRPTPFSKKKKCFVTNFLRKNYWPI
jgi:hypothetical protein